MTPSTGPYRLHVFVPAIMSAGLIFSIATLIGDAVRRRDHYSIERTEIGLRPRSFYLLVAAACWGIASYVLAGALLNYVTAGSYVADIVWLLAASVLVAAALGVVGGVCAVAFWRWPLSPAWVRPFLRGSPLGAVPPVTGFRAPRAPSIWLTGATLAVGTAFALVTLAVGSSRDSLARLDENLATEIRSWAVPGLVQEHAADLGRTPTVLVVAIVVGIATLRCRTFATGWLLAVLAGLTLNALSKALVERPRPSGLGEDSFPSGHLIQITLLAVLLPVALRVLTRSAVPGTVGGMIAAIGVVPIALSRVQDGGHWPSDVLGGILLGGLLGLSTLWIVAHEHWHSACSSCPWREPVTRAAGGAPQPLSPDQRPGVLRLRPATARWLRWAARAWLLVALLGFAVLAWTVGFPADPEGDTLVSSVAEPLQLGLLAVAGVGGAVALRWEAVGAGTLAVSALGLGMFSAVQYQSLVAYAVTAVFAVPAAVSWLVWQHLRTLGAVFLLAAVTAFTLTAEGIAATRIYEHFFGPATAVSSTAGLDVDRVEWVWSGAITTDGARVVARLAGGVTARLVVDGPDEARFTSPTVRADSDRLVRMAVGGLKPGVRYAYTIEVDGHEDRARGRGSFTTAPDGPASFVIAVGGCARTGSNAAVFDAIRAEDPLLYVITGDMHYSNLAVDRVESFLNAYDKVLTAPAQAALYRAVPVDYVWDDHDYGPNDADASSPSRAAARAAYRAAVPHPSLGADSGAIYHAFTIGRVRFVVTDTRSERTAGSMLGDAQERWLLAELAAADDYGLIVWVNPDPWIAESRAGADNWGGYPEQRRRIADAIADLEIDNLVMLSGDAHMVALDDGTNSDYSTRAVGGFPVLHAAALDRPGSVKGGPYSEGAFPGAGQFGIMRVTDDGDQIIVDLEGRNYTGDVLVSYRFVSSARSDWGHRA